MAGRAMNLREEPLTTPDSFVIFVCLALHRHRQRGLEHGGRSDVADGQLICDSVLVGIGIQPESFDRLHSMMLVERVNAEFPHRTHSSLAREWPDDEIG